MIVRRSGPIGLDIGSSWIKAAQHAGRTLRVHAFPRREPGALTPAEAERIAAVLDRTGFEGPSVVIAAPPDAVLAAVFDAPAHDGPALLAAARAEIARVHRVDPRRFELAARRLPGAARPGGGNAAAFAVSHHAADTLLDPLEAAGLDARSITLHADALVRAADDSKEGTDDAPRVIADLGASACSIILRLQSTSVFERRCPDLGLDRLARDAAAALAIDPAEVFKRLRDPDALNPAERRAVSLAPVLKDWTSRIASEIAVSLDYLTKRYRCPPAGRVTLTGGGACIPGLDRAIEPAARCPVVAFDHPTTPPINPAAPAPLFAAAIGLADPVVPAIVPINAPSKEAA
ncbi:MAG: hypothetical protein HRU70_01185 [Phycisphaeraceae bacterium]|nr:MAG: hypothetical protein HRU70_01185 [Phycisphaeraceae bacterium]